MKLFFFIPALIITTTLFSQDEGRRYVHKGLFRAEGTFTPGIFLNKGLTATYLSGNIEYYFHENTSVRGDGYYFLGFLDSEKPLVMNHSIFSGVSLHLPTKNHLDPYLFFQPGLAIAQSNEINPCPCPQNDSLLTSSISQNPLISLGTGVNFYFQKVFHIFAEVRFTHGKHQGNFPARSLTDLKFSFGLGFNLF